MRISINPIFRTLMIFCTLGFILFSGTFVFAQQSFPVIFESTRKAVLSAQLAGVLTSIKYEVGAYVKKGKAIARIDTRELQLRKKRANLSAKHLKVQVEDLERLIQSGLATNEDLAKARMERDVSRTDISILKLQISKSGIYAPFSCVLVRRMAQPHEWVTAGQPVVEVIDPSKLKAVGNIPSQMAVTMKKGDKHTFYITDLDISVEGTVLAVVPIVDELSNTAQVVWKVEKGKTKLMAGMKGEVRFDRE
ncbi:efflux RND transporter periplasmic adaptor subunit [Desulfobacterales bacterium HSG16]|nr:efflux RND transporter periplasmic adaptor subunit [Desulfobacterales bacterium HSG16]